MALSGTFYGTTTNERVKPKIEWSAVQSIAENYSDVTATLYYSRTNNTSDVTSGQWVGSVTINGNTKQESKRLSITYNSNTLAITHTVRVYHDDYGEKTLTISATGGFTVANSSTKQTYISAEITLDTIPRAATVSAVSGDIGSRVTVVVDRKSTAFTHSLCYAFGGLSGYIRSDGTVKDTEQKMTAATVNFLLPESFYTQIPDDPHGTCTVTCHTYSGDTLIGSDSATFTATANRTLCAPAVSGTVEDVNPATVALTGNSAVLVAGQSTALCTITATAKNSASVTHKSVAGQAVTGDTHTIKNVPQGSIVFSATDSRGYSGQAVVTSESIPYVNLTCDSAARRTDPTVGNALLTLKGRCYCGSFGAAENGLTVTYQVGEESPVTVAPPLAHDHSYNLTVTLTGLDYTMSYPVTVTARDALTEVTKTLTVQKGIPVFDWGEKDFQFHVPVQGDFAGTFQGVRIQPVKLSGTKTFTLQSKWAQFSEGTQGRQALFLFGEANYMLFYGVMALRQDGTWNWSGVGSVSASPLQNGQFQITLPTVSYDHCILVSAEPFEIL